MRRTVPGGYLIGGLIGLMIGFALTVVAEDVTLTTYYPSPRGVYEQVLSGIYYDVNAGPSVPAAAQRFIDPDSSDGISQIQDVWIVNSIRLGPEGSPQQRTITTWSEALPDGAVMMFSTDNSIWGANCPPDYTKLAGDPWEDRLMRIDTAAGTQEPPGFSPPWIMGGSTINTTVTGGTISVARSDHQHAQPVIPTVSIILCQRN